MTTRAVDEIEASTSYRSKQPLQARLALAVLFLALAFGALALGGIHTPVLIAFALACGAALLMDSGGWERPRSVALALLATATGLTLYTLLQCTPLPSSLVHAIAPRVADVWERALRPVHGAGPSWVTLSLDPIATRVEVLRGATYIVILSFALRASRSRRGADLLATGIVGIALLLAVAACLHPAFGAERVFGVYRPTGLYKDRHIAPILNANALAAYLNVGFCLALGSWLNPRALLPRAVAAGAALFLATIQLWVASRGGVATMVVGGIAIAWLGRAKRGLRRGNIDRLLLAAAVVATCAMAVFTIADQATAELTDRDLDKVRVWRDVVDLVLANPFWGVGRGAFESAFPAFRRGVGYLVYTHPENLPLQWGGEWGIPVTLAASCAILWALRPKAALARSHSAIGAWGALVAVGLHNLVDFSSEYPGIVGALVVCAGIVAGGRPSGAAAGWLSRRFASPWWPRAAVAGLGFAVALAASTLNQDLYSDRDALRALADANASREVFHRVATAAILRHPAEPYLPFAGAIRAAQVHDESVVPWIEGVLERAQVYGPAHLVLAQSLRRTSPAQSRLEYRLAVEQHPILAPVVGQQVAALVGSYDDALELLPGGKMGAPLRVALSGALHDRLPATSWRLDDDALVQRSPVEEAALERHANGLVEDVVDRSPWCDATPVCVDSARATAARYRDATSDRCAGHVLAANLEEGAGQTSAAYAMLDHGSEVASDPSTCLEALARLASQHREEVRADGAVERLARLGCTGDGACTAHLAAAASIEDERGNHQRALALRRRALERAPEDDALTEAVAGSSSSLGLHAQALDLYRQLAARHPQDGRWSEALTRERGALAVPR